MQPKFTMRSRSGRGQIPLQSGEICGLSGEKVFLEIACKELFALAGIRISLQRNENSGKVLKVSCRGFGGTFFTKKVPPTSYLFDIMSAASMMDSTIWT